MTDAATRLATPADTDEVIDTLVEAFLPDPFWAYFMGDPEREGFGREPAVRECMAIDTRSYLRHGHTYIIGGHAAALWTPPGVDADTEELVVAFGTHADPEKAGTAEPHFLEVFGHKPEEPHFYLHLIGARDESRGQGLGSALLERVTCVCDSDGILAYLEASTLRSMALYERHGFERLATVDFAPGVALHPMLRTPT